MFHQNRRDLLFEFGTFEFTMEELSNLGMPAPWLPLSYIDLLFMLMPVVSDLFFEPLKSSYPQLGLSGNSRNVNKEAPTESRNWAEDPTGNLDILQAKSSFHSENQGLRFQFFLQPTPV